MRACESQERVSGLLEVEWLWATWCECWGLNSGTVEEHKCSQQQSYLLSLSSSFDITIPSVIQEAVIVQVQFNTVFKTHYLFIVSVWVFSGPGSYPASLTNYIYLLLYSYLLFIVATFLLLW